MNSDNFDASFNIIKKHELDGFTPPPSSPVRFLTLRMMGTPANAAAAAKARERAVDVLDRDVQMQLAASLVYAHTSATTMAQHNFPTVSRAGPITQFLRTNQSMWRDIYQHNV